MWGATRALEAGGPGTLGAVWAPESQTAGWSSAAELLASQQQLAPLQPSGSPTTPGPWASGGLAPEGPGQGHSAASKIYVQGLPQTLQHPVAVAGLFSPFGDVLDVKLYAAEVRLSGGSAVVRMRTPSQAGAAIAALNGVVPEGGWQQLTVRAAETAEQRSNRITAINGRQGGLGSPLQPPPALPPVGPGGALRRVHSARPASSQGSLQCFTGGVLGGEAPSRRSADWALGSSASMDSSRRSSMDASALRGGRSSSDSGSDELPTLAAEAAALPTGELQRLLLEAVLALVGQVEGGQLSLSAMRVALESALSAAKQAGGGDDSLARMAGPNGFRA